MTSEPLLVDGMSLPELEALCAAHGASLRIEQVAPGQFNFHIDRKAARLLADHATAPAAAHAHLDQVFAGVDDGEAV